MMLKLRLRKKKEDTVTQKNLTEALQRELGDYIKREDLREYLAEIDKDEKRKKLWSSLSTRKKIKVLRYVVKKRGEEHGKK